MGDIKFEFNLDKLVNAIALFCVRGLNDLTKLKIAKLLYFADKRHLLENGSPIIGDVYFCMDFGPVPSFALCEMNEAITKSEVRSDDYSAIHKMLRVKKPIFSRYPHFEAKHEPNLAVFRSSEVTILERVIGQYGWKSASQLVTLAHQEATWKIANEQRSPGGRTPIPYDLFFVDAPKSSEKFLARLKADFSGEIISLDSDKDYAEFSSSLLGYEFEPAFDLDKDQVRGRSRA